MSKHSNINDRLNEAKSRQNHPSSRNVKINKRQFLSNVARQAGVPIAKTEAVYDALIVEILESILDGVQLNLNGFGKFYAQDRSGGPATFSKTGYSDDYKLVKFSAAQTVNKYVTLSEDDRKGIRAPGTRAGWGRK